MASHMKTTVQIPDALLADVQKIAQKNNTTFRALVQEGLLHVVERERLKKKPLKLKDCSYPPKHQVKKLVEPMNWEDLRAMIYEGHGG
jgi:hypothetical protein